MIKEVKGWQAGDGIVYSDRGRALEEDARCLLKPIGIFNEATANAVIQNAEAIVEALRELAVWQAARPKDGGKGGKG